MQRILKSKFKEIADHYNISEELVKDIFNSQFLKFYELTQTTDVSQHENIPKVRMMYLGSFKVRKGRWRAVMKNYLSKKLKKN